MLNADKPKVASLQNYNFIALLDKVDTSLHCTYHW